MGERLFIPTLKYVSFRLYFLPVCALIIFPHISLQTPLQSLAEMYQSLSSVPHWVESLPNHLVTPPSHARSSLHPVDWIHGSPPTEGNYLVPPQQSKIPSEIRLEGSPLFPKDENWKIMLWRAKKFGPLKMSSLDSNESKRGAMVE